MSVWIFATPLQICFLTIIKLRVNCKLKSEIKYIMQFIVEPQKSTYIISIDLFFFFHTRPDHRLITCRACDGVAFKTKLKKVALKLGVFT